MTQNQVLSPITNLDDCDDYKCRVDSLILPLDDAIEEIKRRREDPVLFEKVNDFLEGDIPKHFISDEPVLYLARHLVTPNYETLHFVEKASKTGLPVVIGQDTEDIFSPNNTLKKNLGKLPITVGKSSSHQEIFENVNIIDLSEAQGKRICDIETLFGESLVEFHQQLFKALCPHVVELVDEKEWVTKHIRNNLAQNYKYQLAPLIVHGIMFEFYEPEDEYFVDNILIPSFLEVEKHFGLPPLIVNIIDHGEENQKNWNGYQSEVFSIVKQALQNS